MSQGNKDTGAFFISLLITLGLIGAGLWYFGRRFLPQSGTVPASQTSAQQATPNSGSSQSNPSPGNPPQANSSQLNTSQPNPPILAIDGSVSLVTLIKQFQLAYSQVNPALPTTYGVPDGQPNGTNKGLQNLIKGDVSIAVSSRPLNGEELQAGLQAIPIARDAIAIVVGVNNPFQGSLTVDQLKGIYQGEITNWSQVGGTNLPIKVINRAAASGTGSFFQDLVLLGGAFAPEGSNFITLPRDETTPMLQALGNNGIGYSTVTQVANQKTIRILPIENVQPTDSDAVKAGTYPLSRVMYLVVRQSTSPAAKQFIDLVLSPQGQQAIKRVGFSSLN